VRLARPDVQDAMTSRQAPPDPRFDIVGFVRDGDYGPDRSSGFLPAMRVSPVLAMAAMWWRGTGRRLRARNRVTAIVGDRLRYRTDFDDGVPVQVVQPPETTCAVVIPVLELGQRGALAASLASVERARRPGTTVVVAIANAAGAVAGTVALPSDRDQLILVEGATDRADLVNGAAAMCREDVIVTLDPGNILFCDALGAAAVALAPASAEAAYGDELVRRRGGTAPIAVLKPDYDEDLLLQLDYVGPFLAVKRATFLELGGFARDRPGSEERDLMLRLASLRGASPVVHLTGPVYGRDEESASPLSKADAAARLRAREATTADHLRRLGVEAEIRLDVPSGRIEVTRALPNPTPLVSIVVPTRDRLDLLKPCIAGLLDRTDYPAFEVVIADNGSVQPATLAYFDALGPDPRVRIVPLPGPFNYSRINNEAVTSTSGSLLVFLNNDVEVIHPDWLSALVREAARPDIGAVGAKLLYPNRLIQHAGVVLGMRQGLATHAFQFFEADHPGYLHMLDAVKRYSAVTGACLAVSRGKFEEVGGFDGESFPVSLNDVDLCLKLDAAGYRNLVTPHARLIHKESATRRSDKRPDQRERWGQETEAFSARWSERLARDPWYNDRHGRETANFSVPHVSWPADPEGSA